MTHEANTFIVSALCPDRPGIISEISEALYRLGGNIEAISQTIMQGWFTMLLQCAFPDGVGRAGIEAALGALPGIGFMVRPAGECGPAEYPDGEPYVLTVIGADQPGIVRMLSRCCARRAVNIGDVWNEVRAGRFITIFHVSVPRGVDPGEFRGELERASAALGVETTLQHQNIFTATNSLQVFTRRGADRKST